MASPVLVNTSAVLGLAMSLAYCIGDSESLIISSRITSMSWQQWATFGGQFIGHLLLKCPFGMSRFVSVRAAGLHHPDQVAAAGVS